MRNLSIEYLRVIFMALIVLLHLIQFGYGEAEILASTRADSYVQLILMMFGKLGVPGFIFITGYYGAKLNGNRLGTLWIQCSFYALLSLFLNNILFKKSVTVGGIIHSLLPLAGGYWFIEDYIIIMLFAPLINEGINKIDKKKYTFIVVGLCIIVYLILWLRARNSAMSLLLFFVVYVIGRYLALHPCNYIENKKYIFLSLSVVALIVIPIVVHYYRMNYLIKMYVITYYNIFTIIAVVSIFITVCGHNWLGQGNLLTKNVLAVYLVHCSPVGQKILNDCVIPHVPFSILSTFGLVIVVFLVSIMIEETRKKICNKMEQHLGSLISQWIGVT